MEAEPLTCIQPATKGRHEPKLERDEKINYCSEQHNKSVLNEFPCTNISGLIFLEWHIPFSGTQVKMDLDGVFSIKVLENRLLVRPFFRKFIT